MELEKILSAYVQEEEIPEILYGIFGLNDAKKLTGIIECAAKLHLGASIVDCFFVAASIGAVFGLKLSNQSEIVLKVFARSIKKNYLLRMNEVQRKLSEHGFPAPKPMSDIFAQGQTHAGFYELMKGSPEDPHQAKIRDELAEGLAQFSHLVKALGLKPMENFIQLAQKGALWPPPHKSTFSLSKSSKGAGFIRDVAQKAQKILKADRSPKMLAHTDWGAKNAVFYEGKLSGVFDWDSLGSMTEADMVGRASAQFCAVWEQPWKNTATKGESELFVKAYEKARGRRFPPEELKVVQAARIYLIALIARQEHASGTPIKPGDFRALLSSMNQCF